MFNIISVGTGILFFVYALSIILNIWNKTAGEKLKNWWILLSCLVIGFLIGYVLFVLNLINKTEIIHLETVIAQVFLWGSVFVVMSFKLFQVNLNEISQAKQELEKAFKELKYYSDIKAKAISEKTLMTSEELGKKVKELEEFHDVTVGREIKMAEMEKELKELRKKVS